MAPSVAKMLGEVLSLSSAERAELALEVLRSLHGAPIAPTADLAAEQLRAIDHEIEEIDAGRSPTRPVDKVIAEIRADLASPRADRSR